MPNFNQVIMIGHVTRDPAIRTIPSGMVVADFGIASNRKYKDKQDVCFIDCTAWDKQAELIRQYVHKGDPLMVVGYLKLDQWEKDGVKRSKHTLVVNQVQFLGGKKDDDSAPQTEAGPSDAIPDDSIPF